jgi:ribosomal protein S18
VSKVQWVDYKDVNTLRRLLSDRGKIKARRVTGTCRQHQRDVAVAIKTARELALLPYVLSPAAADKPRRGGTSRDARPDGNGRPDLAEPAAQPPPDAPAAARANGDVEVDADVPSDADMVLGDSVASDDDGVS